MDPGKSPLETALSDLARSRERELETHPAAGELTAYLDGELSPPDQERLRDHLALCRPCARLVRDLAAEADLEVPDEVERRLDHDVESAWETLKRRLGGGGGTGGNNRQERTRESLPLFGRKPFLPFAFAASLVMPLSSLALAAHAVLKLHARVAFLLLGLIGLAGGMGWAMPFGVLVGEGQQVIQQVKGTESHSYRIHLQRGDFLRAVIHQRGVDVKVVWRDPAGRAVLTNDGLYGRLGVEEVSAVAEETGEHWLTVARNEPLDPPGSYQLGIAEVRPATPEDRIRFEGAAFLSRADELRRADAGEESLRSYAQALARWQATGHSVQQAETLYRMGWVHSMMGRHSEALAFYRRVEPLWRGSLGEGYLFNRMGLAHRHLGDPEAAFEAFEQARRAGARRPFSESEAYACQNLASELRKRGHFQQARNYLRCTERIFAHLGNPHPQALLASDLGTFYLLLGQPDQAFESFRRAIRFAQKAKRPDTVFTVRMFMSLAHLHVKQYGEARAIADQLLADRKGRDAAVLNLVALIELEQERRAAARSWHEKALRAAREQGDAAEEAQALANLAYIYGMEGDSLRALQCFDASERYYRRLGDLTAVALGRFGRALVFQNRGRFSEALAEIERSLDLVETMRSNPWSSDLRASFLARRHTTYAAKTEILMDLHQREPGSGHDLRAFEASETARARTLLEAVASRDPDLSAEVDAALLGRESLLKDQLRSGEEQLMRLTSEEEEDDRSDRAAAQNAELRALRQSLETVQESMRRRHPHFTDPARPIPLTVTEIQQRVLDEETLLLAYFLGPKRSFVWLLGRNFLLSRELPETLEIERLARKAYTDFSRPVRRGQSFQMSPAMVALSERILGPVAEHLGSKRLLVVPDGALHYIPFAALPDPREPNSGHPLILRSEVVVLPSASVLDLIRRQAEGRQRPPLQVAVLADPVFTKDDPRVPPPYRERPGRTAPMLHAPLSEALRSARSLGIDRLDRLEHSQKEADEILALAPGSLAALGFAASRDVATSPVLARYRIVHFATHGLFNPRYPQLSGIVLTLIDRKGRSQDGFLHTSEIYSLDLPVELVVLSACKTALGEDVRGEGLVGLTRGFFHAGASRVAVSLWSVDDRATAELMGRFYSAMLKDHLPPAAALRRAQVSLLRENDWSAPYHWAAFVLQGEWR